MSQTPLYPFDYVHDQRDQKTNKNHGSDRQIKSEIFFLNFYVAGQAANPMQFVVKEVNHQTDNNEDRSKANNVFPCVLIHFAIYKQLSAGSELASRRLKLKRSDKKG